MILRVIFGVAGTLFWMSALIAIGHIAWDELLSLRYVSRLDRWAEDVPEWQ